MFVELAERDLPVDVGVEPLLSVSVLQGLVPVGGSELEDAVLGPTGEQAEDVAHVGPGLDAVHLAARQERDEGGVDVAAVVASDKEPVFTADGLAPKLKLADVVVQRQAPIFEKNRCRATRWLRT